MKIERINSDRLQITLTYDDMNGHDIDFARLCTDREELDRFISFLLIRAKLDTGFDLYSGQFLIRAVQSEKELVLTITRINEEIKNAAKKAALQNGARFRLVAAKDTSEEEPPRSIPLLIRFEQKTDFAAMIKALSTQVDDTWKLYCREDQFFLHLQTKPADLTRLYAAAVEFGEVLLKESYQLLVLEGHDCLLAQGEAVKKAAELY